MYYLASEPYHWIIAHAISSIFVYLYTRIPAKNECQFFWEKQPIFTNFLPQSAWSLEKFEKSADLGPFPAKIELLPLEIPRKSVFFWKIFEKLAKKGEI